MNQNKNIVNFNKKQEEMFKTPCTISEAVQIARGVSEDVVNHYHQSRSHLQVSQSIQVDLLKQVVIDSGLITEEEFHKRYLQKAQEIMEMQEKAKSELYGETPTDASMSMSTEGAEMTEVPEEGTEDGE